SYGFVRRDVAQMDTNPLDSFQKNMDRFRACVDQSLATAVGDINEKQLQPIFNLLGEQLNRFSKAFDALTAPSQKLKTDNR
ncbi:hypothetical protein KGM_210760B, partial [Danaus plexippus plexippus]